MMSRALAQTCLAFLALFIFAIEAIPPVILPASWSCARRKHRSCMAVMSASMFASLFWMIWKDAIGLPNCTLSLAGQSRFVGRDRVPYSFPRHHGARGGKHLV